MSKFRDWLYDNGLTIKDFSALIEVNRSSVHRWIKGDLKPSPKTMLKIKQATEWKISAEDLLDKRLP